MKSISYQNAIDFLLPRHYAGRKPQISHAFGWFFGDRLVSVCTFGKPASPTLCSGIMGGEYSSNVFELNRLCRLEDVTGYISEFVGACLRLLQNKNYIIVAYSDQGMHHTGYIYQACNFLYTGATKKRTDKYTRGNKHQRHYSNNDQQGKRKVRTAKHRYIYFCTKDRQLKKEWRAKLTYPTYPYPKGVNKKYVLGEYQKPEIIYS